MELTEFNVVSASRVNVTGTAILAMFATRDEIEADTGSLLKLFVLL